METMDVKLLKDWGDYKAGAELRIDKEHAQQLIDDGTAISLEDARKREEQDVADEKKRKAELQAVVQQIVAEQQKGKSEPEESESAEKRHVAIEVGQDRRLLDPTDGFEYFGQFAKAVRDAGMPSNLARGNVDQRLIRRKTVYMQEGDDDQGGFLVPEGFRAELLQRTYETGAIISRCRDIPMGSQSIKFPAINETSRADGSRQGGVRVYWTAELGRKETSKPNFTEVELNLHKLTGLAYVSDEMLEDSAISVEPLINKLFVEELRFVLDNACIRGTGAGQPLGIMNAGALVTQAAEPGQAAATIVSENIINMWSRLYAPCRANAVWFISQDIEPQLYTMAVAIGAGGALVYLPANGLSGSPYATLFGRPVIPVEHCYMLGTAGDVILADFAQYLLARKSNGIKTASSIHLLFDYNITAFRFELRVDGQPWWRLALTPYNGGATQSPFVVCATRP